MRSIVPFLTSFRPKPIPELSTLIRQAGIANQREADKDRAIHMLSNALVEVRARELLRDQDESENEAEFAEAVRMFGAGPWRMPGVVDDANGKRVLSKESASPLLSAQGAYGDTELALQNVEWRREINLSWLEFSRWGIQQIILISRLYFIKNPLIQRGINVAAQYVFGRGVEISSTDEAANEVLQDFLARNKKTLGQIGLADLEKRKYYDGNLFFVFFADKTNTGEVNIRTIDATEIMEIVCDPDDTEVPQYYRREWISKVFDPASGSTSEKLEKAWYPAINYEPPAKPMAINGVPVLWDSPVLHRRCGGVAKWHFGCPLVYAALDWAKAARRFLEACMTIRQSLAQFSMTLTTKGGQQALQGAKQQLSTTVGPSASLWDQNPTAVDASIFASGPGTKLEAFNTKGAGGDPAEVREYKLMVAMTFGIPESFFSDMNTSNLATATSLDRPTELNFMEKQEAWREDLCTIAEYVLGISYSAPSGKLREAMNARKVQTVSIREAARVRNSKGAMVYEAPKPDQKDGDVKVMVTFPTIIEADVPAMVQAMVQSMTLGTGAIAGIDERQGILELMRLNGIPDPEELIEMMYPSDGPKKYDPYREPPPEVAVDPVTGQPVKPAAPKAAAKEALGQVTAIKNALARVGKAIRVWEAETNNTQLR